MTVPPAEVQQRGADARVERAEHMDRASTERAAHERDEGAGHSGERCDEASARWVLRTARGEFVLTSSVVLGRAQGCDLQVDDDSVSRRHAFIRVERDAVWVEDQSSRNGTWVNGARIAEPKRLAHGDKIGVGTCEFQLCAAAALDGSRVTQPVIPLMPPLQAGQQANDLDNKSIAPAASAEALAQSANVTGGPSLSALSPRERAVFPLLASGLSQREIASQCGVTVKTIETYRTRIGHKLGLSTRAEFIRFALEIGVLRPSRANVPQATDAAG